MTDEIQPDKILPEVKAACPCDKPLDLCICAAVTPVENRLYVLVLQHPQEQDVRLGSARPLCTLLQRARLRVGLSWANLTKAIGGDPAAPDVDPGRWAVLYMGSGDAVGAVPAGGWQMLDRKGAVTTADGIQGLILLDGSWSQAKALWWRNAWLLKLRRLIVHPDFASAYGELRREPRRESVSTLEAAAFALAQLEQRPELLPALTTPFAELITRYRAGGYRAQSAKPSGKPNGWRRGPTARRRSARSAPPTG